MSLDTSSPRSSVAKTVLFYGVMVVGTALLFLWICTQGLGLTAPPPAGETLFGATRAVGHKIDNLLHVLLALVVIIVAARGVGFVFKRLGQPPVIGEIIAGILLGPSLLGRVAPEVYAFLLPPSVAPFLQIIAQVGVILYMFLVGLELNTSYLRRSPHTALAISHASIIVPFLLGSMLALGLYPLLSTNDVPFTAFALFLGVSMSVTAFPVLARILTDRRMQTSALGVMALTCAAVDDVTAWCLLAFVVSVVHSRREPTLHGGADGEFHCHRIPGASAGTRPRGTPHRKGAGANSGGCDGVRVCAPPGVGTGDGMDRYSRALRCLPPWCRHPPRQPSRTRSHRAA